MKVNTLEVVWHKKEAIHAFDTVGTDDENSVRVASGGVDCAVRIWVVRDGFDKVDVSEYIIRAHLFDTFWFTQNSYQPISIYLGPVTDRPCIPGFKNVPVPIQNRTKTRQRFENVCRT